MGLKSGVQDRYLSFLREKGKIPQMKSHGGMIEEDEDQQWSEGEWNDHQDSSGEPQRYDTAKYSRGGVVDCYAFGGEVKAPEHGDEGSPEMSMDEVHRHLAQALMRRKQARPGGAL